MLGEPNGIPQFGCSFALFGNYGALPTIFPPKFSIIGSFWVDLIFKECKTGNNIFFTMWSLFALFINFAIDVAQYIWQTNETSARILFYQIYFNVWIRAACENYANMFRIISNSLV